MSTCDEIPRAGVRHNLSFLVGHFLPYYLGGIFIRRRRFSALAARLGWQPFDPTFCDRLRRHYQCDRIRLSLFGAPVVLLFDPDDIAQVLQGSPNPCGVPGSKAKGMGHFQPDALTISEGITWRRRRPLNEAVLQTGRPVHDLAPALLQHVAAAVGDRPPLNWDAFAASGRRLAARSVFGLDDDETLAAIDGLLHAMARANRLFLLKPSGEHAALESLIHRRLSDAPAGSLLARLPGAVPADDPAPDLCPARQAPHWLFAMADTLPANLIRALALIGSDRALADRVRTELAAADPDDPASVAGLHLLRGCLQEAMRLWPTTPLLARRLLRRERLGATELPPGTQLLIPNNALHRDARLAADADQCRPERWTAADGVPRWAYNHLSNGSQRCAGADLALFVGTAWLARLLARWELDPRPALPGAGEPQPLILDHFALRFRDRPAAPG